MNLLKIRRSLTAPVAAFVLALVIASLALLIAGYNPGTALQAMWNNVDGADGIVTILNYAGRYYVMGVAVAVGFKMNLFNIGANRSISDRRIVRRCRGWCPPTPGCVEHCDHDHHCDGQWWRLGVDPRCPQRDPARSTSLSPPS